MFKLGEKLQKHHGEKEGSTNLTTLECIVVVIATLFAILPGVLAYRSFKEKHEKEEESPQFLEALSKFEKGVHTEIDNAKAQGPVNDLNWIKDITQQPGRNLFAGMADLGQGPKGDHPIKSFAEKVMQSREAAKNDHDHTH